MAPCLGKVEHGNLGFGCSLRRQECSLQEAALKAQELMGLIEVPGSIWVVSIGVLLVVRDVGGLDTDSNSTVRGRCFTKSRPPEGNGGCSMCCSCERTARGCCRPRALPIYKLVQCQVATSDQRSKFEGTVLQLLLFCWRPSLLGWIQTLTSVLP